MTQQAPSWTDDWIWSGATAAASLSEGETATNTGDWSAGVNSLFIHTKSNNAATDHAAELTAIKAGDTLRLEDAADSTTFAEWTASGIAAIDTLVASVPVSAKNLSNKSPSAAGLSLHFTCTAADVEQPPDTPTPPPEPMYGPNDVARSLSTSGERALAQAWFKSTGTVALNKSDAEALSTAISSGQSLPSGPTPAVAPEQQDSEATETGGGA